MRKFENILTKGKDLIYLEISGKLRTVNGKN